MDDVNRNYCIYKYTNKVNENIYIGQTCKTLEDRAGKNGYGYKKCTLFWRAIQKYGWDNFSSEILLSNLTQEEANAKEIEFISYYNSANKNYGYNLTLGGDGVIPNEETCEKISDSLKKFYQNPLHKKFGENNSMYGKHLSEDARRKISEAHKGKPFTEEHKKNLREAIKLVNVGRKHTEETRKKISEITKGENNPFYGKHHDELTKQKLREHKKCKKILFISVNNGEKMIFESMHVASNKMNIPRSRIKHRCENGYRQGDEYYIYYLEEYNNKNA